MSLIDDNLAGDNLAIYRGNKEVISVFSRNKVEFIVIGGVAVAYYKCREQSGVGDMDLLVEPTSENSSRIYEALISLGLNNINLEKYVLAKPEKRIHLSAPYNADILTPRKSDPSYLETIKEAINIKMSSGYHAKIVSIEMLIKLKEIAAANHLREREMHQRERNKHLTDIECLKLR